MSGILAACLLVLLGGHAKGQEACPEDVSNITTCCSCHNQPATLLCPVRCPPDYHVLRYPVMQCTNVTSARETTQLPMTVKPDEDQNLTLSTETTTAVWATSSLPSNIVSCSLTSTSVQPASSDMSTTVLAVGVALGATLLAVVFLTAGVLILRRMRRRKAMAKKGSPGTDFPCSSDAENIFQTVSSSLVSIPCRTSHDGDVNRIGYLTPQFNTEEDAYDVLPPPAFCPIRTVHSSPYLTPVFALDDKGAKPRICEQKASGPTTHQAGSTGRGKDKEAWGTRHKYEISPPEIFSYASVSNGSDDKFHASPETTEYPRLQLSSSGPCMEFGSTKSFKQQCCSETSELQAQHPRFFAMLGHLEEESSSDTSYSQARVERCDSEDSGIDSSSIGTILSLSCGTDLPEKHAVHVSESLHSMDRAHNSMTSSLQPLALPPVPEESLNAKCSRQVSYKDGVTCSFPGYGYDEYNLLAYADHDDNYVALRGPALDTAYPHDEQLSLALACAGNELHCAGLAKESSGVSCKPTTAEHFPTHGCIVGSDQATEDGYTEISKPVLPMLSPAWQLCRCFLSSGGVLQGDNSDVRLVLPSGAVAPSETVLIQAAVCTDLDTAYRVLQLSEEVCIMSPVVEYFARADLQFARPVQIFLPHFLPPGFDPAFVDVYCFQHGRDASGDLRLSLRKLRRNEKNTADISAQRTAPKSPEVLGQSVQSVAEGSTGSLTSSHRNEHTELKGHALSDVGSYSTCDVTTSSKPLSFLGQASQSTTDADGSHVDSFEFGKKNTIVISTSHFSGYLCTYCGKSFTPPFLYVQLYASHIEKEEGGRRLDVRSEIWDTRLEIRDFSQRAKEKAEECGLQPVGDRKCLRALRDRDLGDRDDIEDALVGTRLELSKKDRDTWEHLEGQDGEDLVFPVERTVEIAEFVPCKIRPMIPYQVEWELHNKDGVAPHDVIEFWVTTGYAENATEPLRFMKKPEPVVVSPRVKKITSDGASSGNGSLQDSPQKFPFSCVPPPIPPDLPARGSSASIFHFNQTFIRPHFCTNTTNHNNSHVDTIGLIKGGASFTAGGDNKREHRYEHDPGHCIEGADNTTAAGQAIGLPDTPQHGSFPPEGSGGHFPQDRHFPKEAYFRGEFSDCQHSEYPGNACHQGCGLQDYGLNGSDHCHTDLNVHDTNINSRSGKSTSTPASSEEASAEQGFSEHLFFGPDTQHDAQNQQKGGIQVPPASQQHPDSRRKNLHGPGTYQQLPRSGSTKWHCEEEEDIYEEIGVISEPESYRELKRETRYGNTKYSEQERHCRDPDDPTMEVLKEKNTVGDSHSRNLADHTFCQPREILPGVNAMHVQKHIDSVQDKAALQRLTDPQRNLGLRKMVYQRKRTKRRFICEADDLVLVYCLKLRKEREVLHWFVKQESCHMLTEGCRYLDELQTWNTVEESKKKREREWAMSAVRALAQHIRLHLQTRQHDQ